MVPDRSPTNNVPSRSNAIPQATPRSDAIGVADPVSVLIDTYGTGRISDEEIVDLVRGNFVLTPRGIIDALQLRRPIYRKTAAFGHFGRSEPEFTWERTDKAAALTSAAGVRVEVPAEGATRR